jgi:hypothetical protein
VSKVFKVQSAFNSGVLDARLLARIDTKQYFNGMQQGDNVLCLPQGGIKRRPGMEFIADSGEQSRVVPFIFSNTQAYLLVFRNNAIDVYYGNYHLYNRSTDGHPVHSVRRYHDPCA